MSDIDDLQRRLSAALDRIGQGVADMAAAPKDAGQDVDAIRKSLDDAMAAKDRLETRMAELDAELARLRQSNEQLRAVCQSLRASNESGLSDPESINIALAAELEAFRATQSANEAEVRAILDALSPLVGASITPATPGPEDH